VDRISGWGHSGTTSFRPGGLPTGSRPVSSNFLRRSGIAKTDRRECGSYLADFVCGKSQFKLTLVNL
jgi:hypothetical protein